MLSILIVIVSCHHCNPVDPPPPPTQCETLSAIDQTSVNWLVTVPIEPRERSRAIRCNSLDVPVATNEHISGSDPCTVSVAQVANQLAGAHTHPWFDTATEAEGCNGQTNIPSAGVDAINEMNENFGPGDIAFATVNPKLPFYMRNPPATRIDVVNTDGSIRTVQ